MVAETKAKRRSFGDWYLLIMGSFIGLGLAAVLAEKLLYFVGVIENPFPPVAEMPARPTFDRNECLSRNSYRIREADPLISDEMLSGDVASACVAEQERFEGWYR